MSPSVALRPSALGGPLTAATAAMLLACGGGGEPATHPAPAAPCVVLGGTESGVAEEPLSETAPSPLLGITDSLDPENAPVPQNPGEDFVFGALYEPLIRTDCTGRVVPGLAVRWRATEEGRRWTFTLREDARFWGGEPVSARDVARSWREAEGRGLAPWGSARPLAVDVLDDRRLRLTLSRPWSEPPPALTTPSLAVTRSIDEGDWPRAGTGPYRPSDPSPGTTAASGGRGGAVGRAGPGSGSGVIDLELLRPTADSHLPSGLRIRIDPGGDPRDLLDAGADLLFTGDPEALEYAGLRPELSTRPLPWSRRYVVVLATPPSGGEPPPDPPGAFLEGLARDVAREEARAAPGPACLLGALPLPRTSGGGSRIGYPPIDPTARALAERLVALATASPGGAGETADLLRSVGLDEASAGLSAVPVERDPAGTLLPEERARLLGVARRPDTACPNPDPPDPRIVPLVDTRLRIVSRGAPLALAVDGVGVPRIVTRSVAEGGTARERGGGDR